MLKFKQFMGFSVICMLWLAGCGSGTSNNINAPENLDGDASSTNIRLLAINNTPAALVVADSGGTGFDLDQAWIAIEKVEVHLPDGVSCDSLDITLPPGAECEVEIEVDEGDEIQFNGPFYYNLLSGEATPDLSSVILPSGLVKRVDLKLDDPDEGIVLPSGVPDELKEHSVFFAGALMLDAGDTDFIMLLDDDKEIRFESATGATISEALDVNELLLTLDIGQWLQGVDIQSCVDSGDILSIDGTLVISKDTTENECGNIDDIIADNIEDSTDLDDDDSSESS